MPLKRVLSDIVISIHRQKEGSAILLSFLRIEPFQVSPKDELRYSMS